MSASLDWILNGSRTYPTPSGLRLECPTGCGHTAELSAGATVRAQIRAAWHLCPFRDDAVDAVMALFAASVEAPVGGSR